MFRHFDSDARWRRLDEKTRFPVPQDQGELQLVQKRHQQVARAVEDGGPTQHPGRNRTADRCRLSLKGNIVKSRQFKNSQGSVLHIFHSEAYYHLYF